MITVEQARTIADDYAERTSSHWFEPELEERELYWVARVGFIGSCGIVIDRADGRLTVLGSGFPLEDWLWGYERGLLETAGAVRVLAVHDERQTLALLLQQTGTSSTPGDRWAYRTWLRERLSELPADLRWEGDRWHSIPSFRAAEREGWFEFELLGGAL